MPLQYRTDVNAAGQIKVQNKTTGVSITSGNGQVYSTTSSGAITFPVLTTDDVDYITLELPLSQFGELYENTSLNITSTGLVLKFNRIIPLFMSGIYYDVPVQNITAQAATSGTATYYVYVKLELGAPKYFISRTEGVENEITMFIGTITVSTTTITAININKVSRFGTYRPSTTQKGSSFPVSTGHPSQTGSINW